MRKFIPAAKMNGLGNAILILDMRGRTQSLQPAFVRALAQNPQTAFDQIMALYDPITENSGAEHAAYKVEIWNCDGTQAKACGNGSRCLADYLARQETPPDSAARRYYFATQGGRVMAERPADGLVTADMGRPRFTPQALPLSFAPEDMNYAPLARLLPPNPPPGLDIGLFPQTAALLSIGNPHAVFFTAPDADLPLARYPLAEFGAMLEHSPAFPQGVNVSLAQVTAPDLINLRVWERGAGLTQACGTAACAAAIAAHKRGLTAQRVKVALPGGALAIALQKDGSCRMTGSTEYEYGGFINPQTGEFCDKTA